MDATAHEKPAFCHMIPKATPTYIMTSWPHSSATHHKQVDKHVTKAKQSLCGVPVLWETLRCRKNTTAAVRAQGSVQIAQVDIQPHGNSMSRMPLAKETWPAGGKHGGAGELLLRFNLERDPVMHPPIQPKPETLKDLNPLRSYTLNPRSPKQTSRLFGLPGSMPLALLGCARSSH